MSKQEAAKYSEPLIYGFWGLLALVVIVGVLWSKCFPEREDVFGEIVVFTNAVVGEDAPAECLEYEGLPVRVLDESDEVLWTGEASFGHSDIRIPALGCSIQFTTDPLPELDSYIFEAEGLPDQTISKAELEDGFHIVTWHGCTHSQRPCELAEQDS